MFLIEEGEEDEGNIVDSRLLGSAASMPSVYTKPAPSNCIVSNLFSSGSPGPFYLCAVHTVESFFKILKIHSGRKMVRLVQAARILLCCIIVHVNKNDCQYHCNIYSILSSNFTEFGVSLYNCIRVTRTL